MKYCIYCEKNQNNNNNNNNNNYYYYYYYYYRKSVAKRYDNVQIYRLINSVQSFAQGTITGCKQENRTRSCLIKELIASMLSKIDLL